MTFQTNKKIYKVVDRIDAYGLRFYLCLDKNKLILDMHLSVQLWLKP